MPLLVRLTHRRMQMAISFVAGFIFGVAMLHLLPHALGVTTVSRTVGWMVAGMLAMFFLERFFCFHHHDADRAEESGSDAGSAHADCAHDHTLTWGGVAAGLTIHSLIAGIALSASTHVELADHGLAYWPGLAVFLVILLHKPFDALTLGTLMATGGWSSGARHAINGLFALAVPLGAILFEMGVGGAAANTSSIVGCAIAFAAGVFLTVSLSDLLPELQFHHHDRVKLSALLLLGLALAWSVSLMEGRSHGEDRGHGEHGHATTVYGEHVDQEGRAEH